VHHRNLSGCAGATKAGIDRQAEKNLLNSSISSTCPHNMVNLGPLPAEIGFPVWGTPANVNGFRVLASLLHRRHSTDVNQTLHYVAVSWAGTLYIHFALLPPKGILPDAKLTLHPSLAISYIGTVTAWHSSSVRKPHFAAWYKE